MDVRPRSAFANKVQKEGAAPPLERTLSSKVYFAHLLLARLSGILRERLVYSQHLFFFASDLV